MPPQSCAKVVQGLALLFTNKNTYWVARLGELLFKSQFSYT